MVKKRNAWWSFMNPGRMLPWMLSIRSTGSSEASGCEGSFRPQPSGSGIGASRPGSPLERRGDGAPPTSSAVAAAERAASPGRAVFLADLRAPGRLLFLDVVGIGFKLL